MTDSDAYPSSILVDVELPAPTPLPAELVAVLASLRVVLVGWYPVPEQTTPAQARDQFEEAARLRDQIQALKTYSQKQKVVSQDFADRDVFALHVDREEGIGCGVLFQVREGKMIGKRHKYIRHIEGQKDEELILSFVEDYYADAHFVPEEVLLSHDPNAHPAQDTHAIEELLRQEQSRKVPIKVPQQGEKASLVRMATSNAKLLVGEWKTQQMKRERDRIPEAVKSLRKNLQMEDLPRRIDGIDISHLGGTETVASAARMAPATSSSTCGRRPPAASAGQTPSRR